MFWFEKTDAFADWTAPAPEAGPEGYYTTAGVFSDGAIDKGSALLIESLPSNLKGRVADFGAGWGYLASKVLQADSVSYLDLIEAEDLSLECAKLNVVDERAAFHWEDATTFKASEPYDAVVMNPPFIKGGKEILIGASHIVRCTIRPNGSLGWSPIGTCTRRIWPPVFAT